MVGAVEFGGIAGRRGRARSASEKRRAESALDGGTPDGLRAISKDPPIGPTLRLPTTADNRVVSQFDCGCPQAAI